jgi:hypothetical protein
MIIKLLLEMPKLLNKKKIYVKCQNLSKLQRREKFKNWSHYVIGLDLGNLPKKLFIFIVKI